MGVGGGGGGGGRGEGKGARVRGVWNSGLRGGGACMGRVGWGGVGLRGCGARCGEGWVRRGEGWGGGGAGRACSAKPGESRLKSMKPSIARHAVQPAARRASSPLSAETYEMRALCAHAATLPHSRQSGAAMR